jgi:hypothetical protein
MKNGLSTTTALGLYRLPMRLAQERGGAKRNRRGPPRASRRSVFEIFYLALEEIDRLKGRGSYGDLSTFTQDWLKRQSLRLRKRPQPHAHLGPPHKTRQSKLRNSSAWSKRPRKSPVLQRPAGLPPREQNRVPATKTSWTDPLQSPELAQFEQIRRRRLRAPRPCRALPGIADEEDLQTRDKRQQCLAAVSDVIRYCHDRTILGKEAARKASSLPPHGIRFPESTAALHGEHASGLSDPTGLRLRPLITQRVFNMRDRVAQEPRRPSLVRRSCDSLLGGTARPPPPRLGRPTPRTSNATECSAGTSCMPSSSPSLVVDNANSLVYGASMRGLGARPVYATEFIFAR